METLRFENLNLSSEILKAIENKGFEEATPVQAQTIPYILEGRDVIGQAQTGTGKTAAFGIPVLERLSHEEKSVQGLVICPTRELALQVADEIRELAKFKRGVEVLPIYGGQPIDRQIKALKKRPQIIVGTPGRVMDHMKRGTLKIDKVKMVVLDEADEMLDMGFIDDIITILKGVPDERQTLLFSATMPKPILELTKRFLNSPEYVKVVHKELTVPKVEQVYFEVKEKTKTEVLSRLIDMYNPKLSLVFCNTKRKVDELVAELQGRGYFADGLHGDLKQAQRDRVMSKFRNGSVDVLVATDVAARGLDVENIEAVFNYDLPQDEEYYVHRIGRTARAGRGGRAFTFVVGREIYKLRDIQRYSKAKITLKKEPSSEDVEEVRTNIFLEKVIECIEENDLGQYINTVERLAGDDYTSIEIAAALLRIAIGAKAKEVQHEDIDYLNTGAEDGMVRLFINIGRNHNIRPGDIVGGIAGETGMPGKLIGSIDIYDKYTFVEVPREYAGEVINIMKNNQIKGKKINIEPANTKH